MLSFSKKIIATFFVIIAIFSVQSIFVHAQDASNQSGAITLTMSPEIPSPGETVDLDLASQVVDLNTANITWYVDGVATKQGLGEKSFTVQSKGDGDSTAIRAVVSGSDGSTNEADDTISPASVDLVVEPTGYVPPFYQGKALFIAEGSVHLVAIPDIIIDGKKASLDDLTFEWQENGTTLGSLSGVGQDAITISGSVPIQDITISVTILDSSGDTLAQTSKIISAAEPKLLFYEDNPLYGLLFNKSIGSNYYLGQTQSTNIAAEPYFFNVGSDDDNNLNYAWTVNGNPVTLSGKSNELTLVQQSTDLPGTASVTLTLNNVAQIFQLANAGFTVNFGE